MYEAEFDAPVIDDVVAAAKFAEDVVDRGKKTSKRKTHCPPERKSHAGAMAGFGSEGRHPVAPGRSRG